MKKWLKSFGHAIEGLRSAFRSEPNFRFHLLASIVVLSFGSYLGLSGPEWAVILLCIGLVVFAELMNTAVEKLCDLYSAGKDDRIKTIKDVSAGAVLVCAIAAGLCGCIVFLPKIWLLLQR